MDCRIKVLRCKNRFKKKPRVGCLHGGLLWVACFSAVTWYLLLPSSSSSVLVGLCTSQSSPLDVGAGMWVLSPLQPGLSHPWALTCARHMGNAAGASGNRLCFHKARSAQLPLTGLLPAMKHLPLHFFWDFYAHVPEHWVRAHFLGFQLPPSPHFQSDAVWQRKQGWGEEAAAESLQHWVSAAVSQSGPTNRSAPCLWDTDFLDQWMQRSVCLCFIIAIYCLSVCLAEGFCV